MKKEISLALAVTFMACSEGNESSGTASETNAANYAELNFADSSAINNIIDNIKENANVKKDEYDSMNPDNNLLVGTPSLVYLFSTTKETVHEFYGNGATYSCFVNRYSRENGVVQMKSSQESSIDQTYLLRESDGTTYMLQLMQGAYWHDNNECVADSAKFVKDCKNQGGLVDDHYQGCYDNLLLLSCGWKVNEDVDLHAVTSDLVKDCEGYELLMPEEPDIYCEGFWDEDGNGGEVCDTTSVKR